MEVEGGNKNSTNKNDIQTNNVKILFISDTHSRHEKLGTLPDGDILIHAGTVIYRFQQFLTSN